MEQITFFLLFNFRLLFSRFVHYYFNLKHFAFLCLHFYTNKYNFVCLLSNRLDFTKPNKYFRSFYRLMFSFRTPERKMYTNIEYDIDQNRSMSVQKRDNIYI